MSHLKTSFISTSNGNVCFWDKHEFTGEGVVCPIFYKPKQIVRKKKEYYINQNITKLENTDEANVHQVLEREIYYDDIFCSLSCCISWIEDHYYDPKYKNSKYILFNEYKCDNIRKSNHWRTLKKFGGFLTIEEFRKQDRFFEEIDFSYENNIRKYYYKELNFVQ